MSMTVNTFWRIGASCRVQKTCKSGSSYFEKFGRQTASMLKNRCGGQQLASTQAIPGEIAFQSQAAIRERPYK